MLIIENNESETPCFFAFKCSKCFNKSFM